MTNFSNLASTSHAAGFGYYDIQDFSFTLNGQAVAIVSAGVYHHYSHTYSLPKNRSGRALTSQIMTAVNMNISPIDSAGVYRKSDLGASGSVTTGSAGGFPILYQYEVDIYSDASNLNFAVDVGNPSAVNAVTPPNITISGRAFFYLAPF